MKIVSFLGPIKPILKGIQLMNEGAELSKKEKQKMFRAIVDVALAAIATFVVVAYPRPVLERFEFGCCLGAMSIGAGLLVLTGNGLYRGALLCKASIHSFRVGTSLAQAAHGLGYLAMALTISFYYNKKIFRGGILYQALFDEQE